MRLINNTKISDAITEYNEICQLLESQSNYFQKEGIYKLMEFDAKLFNWNDQKMIKKLLTSNTKIKLVTEDERVLKEYGYLVMSTKSVLHIYNKMLIQMQNKIPKTIEILNQ